MQDMKVHLERLRTDAVECALIRDLATVPFAQPSSVARTGCQQSPVSLFTSLRAISST